MSKQIRMSVKDRTKCHHVVCTNCRSKNTHLVKTNGYVFGAGCILAASISMWIPIVGWVGAILLLVFGIISIFTKYAYSIECKDCGHIESITKEEFEFLRDNGIE